MSKMIKKIIVRINQFLGEISGWLLCAIMLLLTIDFVSRGLSMPVHGVGEIAVFVMVAVVYFGLGHTEATGGHVRVTAVTSRLPAKVEKLLNVIIYIIALCTIATCTWALGLNALKAFNSEEAVAGTVPLLVWPIKFLMLIGCFFYLCQVVLNLIEEIGKCKTGKVV